MDTRTGDYDADDRPTLTTFAYGIYTISIMLGVRTGMWIARCRMPPATNIDFQALLFGVAIFTGLDVLIFLAMYKFHGFVAVLVYVALDIAAAIGAYFLVKPWRDRRRSEIQ